MSKPEPTLAPGQIWTPVTGKRAKAREVIRFMVDPDGYRAVVYTLFWPNCWQTDISSMRVDGFRSWIRKMQATCEVVNQHGR